MDRKTENNCSSFQTKWDRNYNYMWGWSNFLEGGGWGGGQDSHGYKMLFTALDSKGKVYSRQTIVDKKCNPLLKFHAFGSIFGQHAVVTLQDTCMPIKLSTKVILISTTIIATKNGGVFVFMLIIVSTCILFKSRDLRNYSFNKGEVVMVVGGEAEGCSQRV